MDIVLKSISISGVGWIACKPESYDSAIEANKIKPVVDSTVSLDRINGAFAYQESQRHFGK